MTHDQKDQEAIKRFIADWKRRHNFKESDKAIVTVSVCRTTCLHRSMHNGACNDCGMDFT